MANKPLNQTKLVVFKASRHQMIKRNEIIKCV